jgi:membrane-bound lytic murein transglycosylase B
MIKYLKTLVLIFPGLLLAETIFAQSYLERKEVQEFIREMVTKHELDEAHLKSVIDGAVFKQSIIDAISKPAEKVLTWKEYRKIFLTDQRIKHGRRFMREHQGTFLRAEKFYGVPAHIIAAIIGVETFYGQRMGNYRVLDSLATLAFDYPPRASFFRQQLEEFLLLSKEEQQDEFELMGSYAGAMGFGQFIPSSYRAYAVDFDADGIRDIWTNPVDAIGSVANYLSEHRWRKGQTITMVVSPENQAGKDLFGNKLKPYISVGQLTEKGTFQGIQLDNDAQVSPLLFNGGEGEEYWLGLYNFYVITRYNHSKLYAMAVYQLSRELM